MGWLADQSYVLQYGDETPIMSTNDPDTPRLSQRLVRFHHSWAQKQFPWGIYAILLMDQQGILYILTLEVQGLSHLQLAILSADLANLGCASRPPLEYAATSKVDFNIP